MKEIVRPNACSQYRGLIPDGFIPPKMVMRLAPIMGAMSCGKKEMVSQIPIPKTRSLLSRVEPQIRGQEVLSSINDTAERIKPTEAICHVVATPNTSELRIEIANVRSRIRFIPYLSASIPVGMLRRVFTAPLMLFKYPNIRGVAPRPLM